MQAGGHRQQCVSIGRSLDHLLRSDIAGGAGLVFNHYGLTKLCAQFFGDDAGHDVGGTAYGPGHDESHGPVWIA